MQGPGSVEIPRSLSQKEVYSLHHHAQMVYSGLLTLHTKSEMLCIEGCDKMGCFAKTLKLSTFHSYSLI